MNVVVAIRPDTSGGRRAPGQRRGASSVAGAVCGALALLVPPAPAHALTPGEVFDAVKDAVVVVRTLDNRGTLRGQGSGVLISPGRVATNCHVARRGGTFQVGRGPQRVPATLYAEDRDKDICLLDAPGVQGTPAQLGQATALKIGDPVYAVGAPRGLELSLSDGIVAQLRGGPPPVIQTTAAISPGSSGGGLFDENGRLVGLTTLYVRGGQSLNFAMPAEWVREVRPGGPSAAAGRSHIAWRERASALAEAKDWRRLLDWCREWTRSEPENAVAWYGLGVAYGKLTRYREALDAFRQTLRINPKNAAAWYNLGIAYVKTGNRTAALESAQELRRHDPALADKLFNRIVPR